MYLNDWYQADAYFIKKITSADVDEQLDGIQRAAKYYKVIRNFKDFNNEPRLQAVLCYLRVVKGPITHENASKKVTDLAKRFETRYGQYNISAASKFLWLLHKIPIVIYDGRASNCLDAMGYLVKTNCEYEDYRVVWRKAFAEHQIQISQACKSLPGVKQHSLAYMESDATISKLSSSPWFHERVFDKFLWFNSGS